MSTKSFFLLLHFIGVVVTVIGLLTIYPIAAFGIFWVAINAIIMASHCNLEFK